MRAIAHELGVPQALIDKPPTAGLWVGQTDEDEMGFTYDTLEQYLADPASVPRHVAARIEELRRVSEHKRSLPPIA